MPTSPRPALLVFTATGADGRDLYVETATGAPRALTDDAFLDGEAAVSPDGEWIAFVSERAGSLDIWVMRVDGSKPRRLTRDPGRDVQPSWSPDGTRIAFVSDREGDRTNIFLVEVGDGRVSQLTFQDRGLGFAAWSPEGEWIAYSGAGPEHPTDPELTPSYLMRIPADGGAPTTLRAGAGRNWGAAWSPNGDQLAFAWSPAGVAADDGAWLTIVATDGRHLRRLTQGSWGDFDPSWSPDGRQIAFTSTREGFRQIYVWDLQSDTVTVALGGALAFEPSWVPGR